MGQRSYFPYGNTSVTGGSGAWGAWTPVFTPPVALCGFYLGFTTPSYGLFNLFIGNGTPGTPQIENGCFDGSMGGMLYVPFAVEAGQAIQIQVYNLNGTTDAVDWYIVGLTKGLKESLSLCQTLGASTSGNFTNLATTPTQFGTSLALPLRQITLVGGNGNGVASATLTLSIGSTGAENILQTNWGNPNNSYISVPDSFDLDLPPSQDIWLTASVLPTRAAMFLFY